MTLQIRPARAQDIPAIFEIRTSVLENHLSLAQLSEMGVTPDSILAMLQQGPGIWVAEQGQQLLGFAVIDMQEACLFALFVRPGHEGLGIGRQLLQRAEAQLFSQHTQIWLETAGNSRASGFYQRQGWQAHTPPHALEPGDLHYIKTAPAVRTPHPSAA